MEVSVLKGITEVEVPDLPLVTGVKLWDEEEGNVYELSCELSGFDRKTTIFGVRSFADDGEGKFTLNGRKIFLRGETNCAVFPETGHPPMAVESWKEILHRYRAYGVNCVRFHSWCPPQAAFAAADELGMLMQPELSHWNPRNALETEDSCRYYKIELETVLQELANHPSFVMLTLGNELKAGKKGHEGMDELLAAAKETDGTRLYSSGSNVHYGETGCDPGSDFYTAMKYYEEELRGTFSNMEGYMNTCYPGTEKNYNEVMKHIREVYTKPVFEFEVGQYEILPDFSELELFRGITSPENLYAVQKRAEEKGMLENWDRYVAATGEIALLAYREEVEAALRTEQSAGISLLGLQDFPGQGTALIGMMNSHLLPKKYEFARPERFASFFRPQLPLVLLPKYTYENKEELEAEVEIVNYGKTEISGELVIRLKNALKGTGEEETEAVIAEIKIPKVVCPTGVITKMGKFTFSLEKISKPTHALLEVEMVKSGCRNSYGIWIYPAEELKECGSNIYETKYFDEKCEAMLQEGGKIYFSPDADGMHIPGSIKTQFTTDFWSVGTFAEQEGGMGQLIDETHPVFEEFPTAYHTDWQWWPMASKRAVIIPDDLKAIITEMDSYATLRHMAQLFECRCGNAKILFSTMELQSLQQYPEGRALQNAIYHYMDSKKFDPVQKIDKKELCGLIKVKC